MASNVVYTSHLQNKRVIHLLVALFGTDPSAHVAARNIFQLVVNHIYDTDYTIICNDQVVNLAPGKHDQRGQWIDSDHGWDLAYDSFTPCD